LSSPAAPKVGTIFFGLDERVFLQMFCACRWTSCSLMGHFTAVQLLPPRGSSRFSLLFFSLWGSGRNFPSSRSRYFSPTLGVTKPRFRQFLFFFLDLMIGQKAVYTRLSFTSGFPPIEFPFFHISTFFLLLSFFLDLFSYLRSPDDQFFLFFCVSLSFCVFFCVCFSFSGRRSFLVLR